MAAVAVAVAVAVGVPDGVVVGGAGGAGVPGVAMMAGSSYDASSATEQGEEMRAQRSNETNNQTRSNERELAAVLRPHSTTNPPSIESDTVSFIIDCCRFQLQRL